MSAARLPLQRRVMLACTVLGAALSLLFAGATWFVAEHYEDVLAIEVLSGLAEDYSERLLQAPMTELPRSSHLSVYLQRPGQPATVPAALAALPAGFHEAEDPASDGLHTGVFEVGAGRLYIVTDLRDIERIEDYLVEFLAAVIVLGTAVSAWLGTLLARTTIAPVRRLARAVVALDVQPAPTTLAAGMPADDLARLAQAIDGYQARLVEASARESSFFADASHELRTPIAVVRGTAELLLDEAQAAPALQGPLRRLDRGMQQLTDLLDVLLGLARRRRLDYVEADPLELLAESVVALTQAECGADVQVEIDAAADAAAQAPIAVARHEALLLLRCLLRSLLPPDAAGVLRLHRHGAGFELSFATAAPASARNWDAPGARSDAGRGQTLVGRLAAHLGWQVSCRFEDGRQVLEITLPA